MANSNKTSSGVQELIDRLREEGVSQGQTEADSIVDAARRQALEILDEAQQKSDDILNSARHEAEQTRINGEQAVRLAGRDAILQLTDELRNDFEHKLRALIGHTLDDAQFLKHLILTVAGHAIPQEYGGPVNILLPAMLPGQSDAEQQAAEENEQKLRDFVRSLMGEAARDGLTVEIGDEHTPGIRVQIVEEDIEIDLSAESLTHLLQQRLSPRFRAIIREQA